MAAMIRRRMGIIPLWLSIPVLVLLAILFGRNVHAGFKTGLIWDRGTRVYREKSAFWFWFTLAVYSLLTAGAVAGAGLGIWALAVLRR